MLVTLIVCTVIELALSAHDASSSIYWGSPVGDAVFYSNGSFETVNNGEYPFMASLEYKGSQYCGASIIRRDVVLTAAHCTHQQNAKKLAVRAGTYVKEAQRAPGLSVQYRKVKKIVVHEYYNLTGHNENDISIVWLRIGFKLTPYVGVLSLPSHFLYTSYLGESVTILGWGYTHLQKRSRNLLKATVIVTPKNECPIFLSHLKSSGHDTFCIKSSISLPVGPCQHDSGGPIISTKDKQHTLIGVITCGAISGSISNCVQSYGAGATDVGYFNQWIQNWLAKIKRKGKSHLNKEK